MHALVLVSVNPLSIRQIKFEMPRFTHTKCIIRTEDFLNVSRDTDNAH